MTKLDNIATMARPYGFIVDGGGACPAYLSRPLADGGTVTIGTSHYDGPNLDDAAPSAPLFLLGATMPDGDYRADVGELHPEPLPLLDALLRGRALAEGIDRTAATLAEFGFTETTTGGNCLAMERMIGAVQILVTDGEGGAGLPSAEDWTVGIYTEEFSEGIPFDRPEYPDLRRAIAAAIQKAATMAGTPIVAEFPSYDRSTLPPIPAHWVDRSWHNEPCPSFQIGEADGVIVFVDFADPADREFPEAERFSVHGLDQHGQMMPDPCTLLASDDWEAVLSEVATNERMKRLREGQLTLDDAVILLREESAAERPCRDMLSHLRAIIGDDQAQAVALLKDHYFTEETMGGGMVSLALNDPSGWHILATDSEGGGLPSLGDFCLGVYPPGADCSEMAVFMVRNSDDSTLAEAITRALAFYDAGVGKA